MARDYAIYMNGVRKGVLDEMIECLNDLPEQAVYLQPYDKDTIVQLRDASPPVSDEDRVLMVFSTMEDLTKVYYCAEVVRWEDKQKEKVLNDKKVGMPQKRRDRLNQLIRILQPNNCGRIYMTRHWNHENHLEEAPGYKDDDHYCKNLISLRNVRQIEVPFGVGEMFKTSDDQKVAQRTTPGGWVYVHEKPKDRVELRTLLNKKP
jgi:hypothetical protein